MEIVILKNADAVAKKGAQLLTELIRQKSNAILGLATGRTPIALYEQLIGIYRTGEISFAEVSTFNLDEYLGIDEDDDQSYRAFMNAAFFDHIDIDIRNTYMPFCKEGENPRTFGLGFENEILCHGGIDLQILGIGGNGHIGFNEPASSLKSRTRVKALTQRTLQDNKHLFDENEHQPRLAMTMGIATILDARKIILLATGSGKAEAVQKMVEGPLSSMCPASALQLHQHVSILLDEKAAAKLQNQEYYLWVYEQNETLRKQFGSFYNI